MKPRLNQSVKTPGGRCGCLPAERLATTFVQRRRPTRFALSLPPGVLVRLLTRQSRLGRGNGKETSDIGQFLACPGTEQFRSSSIGALRR